MITEPGPNKILAKNRDAALVKSILAQVRISVEKHKSAGLAVVGHYDCAGNPVGKDQQIIHIKESIRFVRRQFRGLKVLGLWVDKNWKTHEV